MDSLSRAAMDTPKRILIVEDDLPIAELLQLHLADAGFATAHAPSGDEALRQVAQGPWDALLLDLMLPGVDGLEVCRRTRAMGGYLPIVMMSAKAGEVHRIEGLELGADDYVGKPFSVLEVVARVRALLRRVDALARDRADDSSQLEIDGLQLDAVRRCVRLDGRSVDLTPREFDLLYFFVRHPEQVFSRSELLERIWGHQHDGYEHTVNTHINRLRNKLEPDPANPRRIVTAWGRGYKLATVGAAGVVGR